LTVLKVKMPLVNMDWKVLPGGEKIKLL